MLAPIALHDVDLDGPPESGATPEQRRRDVVPVEPLTTRDLMALLYGDLTTMASWFLARETPGHAFEPTDLVHESYLKVSGQTGVVWRDGAHFLAINAQAMRRILIDHARTKHRKKRGGAGRIRVELQDHHAASGIRPDEILAADELLAALSGFDPSRARILELRYFGGLGSKEVAAVLKVSVRTVERYGAMTRAWFVRHLATRAS
jgi:RNA polymerase sigma-70 factor, ECF subfamily